MVRTVRKMKDGSLDLDGSGPQHGTEKSTPLLSGGSEMGSDFRLDEGPTVNYQGQRHRYEAKVSRRVTL
jgi:hypothetical protein